MLVNYLNVFTHALEKVSQITHVSVYFERMTGQDSYRAETTE